MKTLITNFKRAIRCSPTEWLRRVILITGVIVAAVPAWELAKALFTAVAALATLACVLGFTAGALWMTSNWRQLGRGLTTSANQKAGRLVGEPQS